MLTQNRIGTQKTTKLTVCLRTELTLPYKFYSHTLINMVLNSIVGFHIKGGVFIDILASATCLAYHFRVTVC